MTAPAIRRELLTPAVASAFACLSLLTIIWSVTGTIALRNALEVLLIAALPWLRVDGGQMRQVLRQPASWLIGALTLWILFHNLWIAWDADRAWYESEQWFKSALCFLLGAALACAPRKLEAPARWRFWILAVAGAWALHLVLNVALKDWSQQPVAALQASTRMGSRDMVSYLGTGLLALLLADAVARLAGGARLLPMSARWLWAAVLACILLTTATLTRNALPVMAAEAALAIAALIGTAATRRQRIQRSLIATAILALLAGMLMTSLALDQRWGRLKESLSIGWDIDRYDWWLNQVDNPRPLDSQGVPVDHSAYSRAAWLHAALRMIGEHPLGSGYDRNALRRTLARHYPLSEHAPGHAHAGLVDFTLGTGLPGGALALASLLAFTAAGWRRWQRTRDPAGLALSLFAVSYLLRAAVDGIVRDHMLEQALFVLGLLLAATQSSNKENPA